MQQPLATEPRPSRAQIEPAALALLSRHSAGLLATARRYSASPEDAEDAYQRGVEILLTKAPSTIEEELLPWLKTVAIRESYRLGRAAHLQDIEVCSVNRRGASDGAAVAPSRALRPRLLSRQMKMSAFSLATAGSFASAVWCRGGGIQASARRVRRRRRAPAPRVNAVRIGNLPLAHDDDFSVAV
jgi:Sigma-70 region 2